VIPEESEVASDVIMIKPLNGVEVQKMAPIIKKTDHPSVRLSPLDLEPNNYLAEFQIFSNKSERKEGINLNESKFGLSSREENTKINEDILKSVSVKLDQ
jgi:hypothetical protein